MNVVFRKYKNTTRFGEDYGLVRDFIRRINKTTLASPNFPWARWAWMMSRPVDHESLKDQIGLWEDKDKLVGLVTFEDRINEIFIICDPDYGHLKAELLNYAIKTFSVDGNVKVMISDQDKVMQHLAWEAGLVPTTGNEKMSYITLDNELEFTLPTGFGITYMSDSWDFSKYNRVMWRGFNHEGPVPETEELLDFRRTMLSSPDVNPSLVIAITDEEGNYVSHCGLWYKEGDRYALVEPVATDPDFRKMGLGKAAVLTALNRARILGAQVGLVGSSQQFYYNIGFSPMTTESWWDMKSK